MTEELVTTDERIAILNLLAVDGIGSGTVIRLVGEFGSAQAVFETPESRLLALPRFTSVLVSRIKTARSDGEIGRQQFEQATEHGIRVITLWDEDYPPILRELETDAPAVLFVRGTLKPKAERLAVVGTRSATAYGKHVTHDLIVGLRGSGIHIISGLASGIDGFAHAAALEAGLTTEAVFGCGVDRIYPPVNTALANRVLADGGALISEYPMGTEPDRHHFPQRNRIIAGLSKAVLVVEAGDRSGALITARLAIEYNRDVMAVPGSITNPKTAGCHGLIKLGAALIDCSDDILQALRPGSSAAQPRAASQEPIDLPGPESDLFAALDPTQSRHIDDIAALLDMPVGEALGYLLLMELKGAVKQLPGKYFVRA